MAASKTLTEKQAAATSGFLLLGFLSDCSFDSFLPSLASFTSPSPGRPRRRWRLGRRPRRRRLLGNRTLSRTPVPFPPLASPLSRTPFVHPLSSPVPLPSPCRPLRIPFPRPSLFHASHPIPLSFLSPFLSFSRNLVFPLSPFPRRTTDQPAVRTVSQPVACSAIVAYCSASEASSHEVHPVLVWKGNKAGDSGELQILVAGNSTVARAGPLQHPGTPAEAVLQRRRRLLQQARCPHLRPRLFPLLGAWRRLFPLLCQRGPLAEHGQRAGRTAHHRRGGRRNSCCGRS